VQGFLPGIRSRSKIIKKSMFESLVEKAFWGLESKFGFKKIETRFLKRSVTVLFQNATTQILLNYEIGNKPWLEIADVKKPGNKTTLGWLLVEAGVDQPPLPEQAFHPTKLNEDKLESVLQSMGQQLLDQAVDLLKGDFTRMQKLQKRAAKYARECDRYLAIRKPRS